MAPPVLKQCVPVHQTHGRGPQALFPRSICNRLQFLYVNRWSVPPGATLRLTERDRAAAIEHPPNPPYTGCMFSKSAFSSSLRAALAAAGLVSLAVHPPAAHAWGNEGHRIINRLAAATLPADVPAFLRSQPAIDEIEYLGPEPDRWRSPAEPELVRPRPRSTSSTSNWPTRWAPCRTSASTSRPGSLPPASGPEKIGLQPWETTEVWERLKAAMRQYRAMAAATQDTAPVEAGHPLLCRLARPLRRRRLAAPAHHHPVQRLDRTQSQRLHHRRTRFTTSSRVRL